MVAKIKGLIQNQENGSSGELGVEGLNTKEKIHLQLRVSSDLTCLSQEEEGDHCGNAYVMIPLFLLPKKIVIRGDSS